MRIRTLITALLAGPAAILMVLIAYSTANTVLWNQFLNFTTQKSQGTTTLADLSPWSNDLQTAWNNDLKFYTTSEYAHASDRLIHYPLGLTIDADNFRFGNGLGIILLFMLGASLTILLLPPLIIRLFASTKSPGLSKEFFTQPTTQSKLRTISFTSILIALLLTPPLAVLSWYLSYDRIQSSFDLPSGATRWARYVTDSFYPMYLAEWIALFLIPTLIALALIRAHSKRFIANLPPETRLAHQHHCPNKKCHYPTNPSLPTCPECGLHWKDAITNPPNPVSPTRFWTPKKRTLAVLILIALPLITLASLSQTHRYQLHNWLALRQDDYTTEKLYLAPSRPVRLQWGTDTLWITIVKYPNAPFNPNKPADIGPYHTVYQLNTQPLVLLPQYFDPKLHIVLNNAKVLSLHRDLYPRQAAAWIKHTHSIMQIYQTPTAVLGFPADQPLSEEAKEFLNQAKALIPQ